MKPTRDDWKDCLLGDAVTLKRGYDLTMSDRKDGPYPVITSSGFSGYHNEAKVKGPGVVTGRYGTLGEIHYVETDFWPHNTALYVRDFKGNHPKFISYFLDGLHFNTQNAAAAVPGVNRNFLHMMPVRVPPLPLQRRIAGILSAYDDLIENNTRRIQILERMAQALYREWFVQFRFPDHAKTKLVQSPFGKVPQGWEITKLRDICERVDYGYTASANKEPVGPKFLRITDIVPSVIDWPAVPYCELGDDDIDKYRLQAGDIVIARTGATTGYAKRLNKRNPDSVFASYLVRIRVRKPNSNHVFGLVVESDDYKQFVKTNLSGSAQPQANAQVLTSLPVVLPPPQLQTDFTELVEPMLDQKEILELKNTNLRRTRDLLLPKLISGALDVSKLDIETA
jgi:type I restriction enzyme, S subunit